MTEKSVFIWNAPTTPTARRAKRDQLVAIGCNEVFFKGFGDDGGAYVGPQRVPGNVWPQWSDGSTADFAPLTITLWGYPWPRPSDVASCVAALKARWSDRVVLNPETEWRWQNSNANPWNSLAEANAAALQWMRDLKAACQATLGRVPSFWLSGCPSWVDFPYEGFMAECDGSLPEHYFFEADMAHGEDMVAAHIRRAGRDKPCTPVLTCCGEYNDDGVVGLATLALRDYPQPQGFGAWEAGNGAFQADAMRRAYALLPAAPSVIADAGKVLGDALATPVDPGFPGAVQPDRTVQLNGVVLPGAIADQLSKLSVIVFNAQEGKHYQVTWDAHQWSPYQEV